MPTTPTSPLHPLLLFPLSPIFPPLPLPLPSIRYPQLFFGCMSLALLGVKQRGDKRDAYLHHGHPLAKLGLWLLFTCLPFLFPNEVLNVYSEWGFQEGGRE